MNRGQDGPTQVAPGQGLPDAAARYSKRTVLKPDLSENLCCKIVKLKTSFGYFSNLDLFESQSKNHRGR